MSCDCCVALPCGAMGLSAVCDCDNNIHSYGREHSGSVVEGLTRDQGVAGSSLIGVTALCP